MDAYLLYMDMTLHGQYRYRLARAAAGCQWQRSLCPDPFLTTTRAASRWFLERPPARRPEVIFRDEAGPVTGTDGPLS
jgi:hypothetical protein